MVVRFALLGLLNTLKRYFETYLRQPPVVAFWGCLGAKRNCNPIFTGLQFFPRFCAGVTPKNLDFKPFSGFLRSFPQRFSRPGLYFSTTVKTYSHTNIVDDKFLCFNVKGIMELNVRLRNALLFSILSYMTNSVLGVGNCAAVIDELYLFLTNLTAIEYIRNLMKRARKRESSVVIASQNIEDFLMDGVRELTKPLFAIPTHQVLFNAGQTEPRVYIDTLQLEEAEFELIRYPEKGTCLYRCGNERYLLQVIFPEFKKAMFGTQGGR